MNTISNKTVPTIREVARRAQVSIATVSRALNTPSSVRPETLIKVQKAIKALGYTPNNIARSLKINASMLVGIIIPDILNPFFARVVKGVEETIDAKGYTAVICDSEENPTKENKYVLDLLRRRADGIVTIPSREKSDILNLCKGKDIPLVFVDRYDSEQYDSIRVSNLKGMSLLISHLVQEGCSRIGLVGGPSDTLPGRERFDAYRQVLASYRLPYREEYVAIGDFSVEAGFKLTKQFLENLRDSQMDAIIVVNNLMGIGALRAVKETGTIVPDEVAVGIFDDISLADLTTPSWTVVTQPDVEIGRAAAKMLLERIENGNSIPPRQLLFEPQLIIRESTRRSSRKQQGAKGERS